MHVEGQTKRRFCMGTPGIVLAHTKQLRMGEGDSFIIVIFSKGFPLLDIKDYPTTRNCVLETIYVVRNSGTHAHATLLHS